MILNYFLFTQTTAIAFFCTCYIVTHACFVRYFANHTDQFMLGKLSRNIWRVSSFRKAGTLKKSFGFLYWAWWLYTQILFFFHVLCINAAKAYVPKCHYDIALPGQRGPLIWFVCRCKTSEIKLWMIFLKLNFHVIWTKNILSIVITRVWPGISRYGVKSWVEWSGVERSGVVEWSLYCRIEL